jgi:hypothetical protein
VAGTPPPSKKGPPAGKLRASPLSAPWLRPLHVGLALFWKLSRRGVWVALRWMIRRSPILIAVALFVYLLLVVRASVTSRNVIGLGNGLYTLVLVWVGLGGLAESLRHKHLPALLGERVVARALPTTVQLWVVATDGTRRARFFLERAMYLVGRGPECDVRVQESTVSRRHCRLVRRAGGYWLEDLGSSHGTSVNGRALGEEPVPLHPGDVVELSTAKPSTHRLLYGPVVRTEESKHGPVR